MVMEFTEEIRRLLNKEGYSHIHQLGCKSDSQDFFIEAIREGDPRLRYEETDWIIEAIGSPEIIDIASGIALVTFHIDLPLGCFKKYARIA